MLYMFRKKDVENKKRITLLLVGMFVSTISINSVLLPAVLETETSAAFNANDFLLSAKGQAHKGSAAMRFLDAIHFEQIVHKMTTTGLTNPESPITLGLADCFATLPTEQRSVFLHQVTTYMQTPEQTKILRDNIASIIESYLDLASIEALTSFFARHRISQFMQFQQALANAMADYFLAQPMQQTTATATPTSEHQNAARTLLYNILAIRKDENPKLLALVNTECLINLAIPLCCFYLDHEYIDALNYFIKTAEGKKMVLRYECIDISTQNALTLWCQQAIQETKTSNGQLNTHSCHEYSIGQLAQAPAANLFSEFKSQCNSIMEKAEEKVRDVCSAIEKLYLRRFSRVNQPTFKKLLTIAGETFDQCMQGTGIMDNKTAITVQGFTVCIQPQDYQTLKNLVKTECCTVCQEISTTQNATQDPEQNRLIDDLLEISGFNTIKMLIVFSVTNAYPKLSLEKEKVEQKITSLMKQLIAANLTTTEITELINFCKSSASQRIQQHVDQFVSLILDSLTPEIIKQLRRVFPWHTIL